MLDYSPRDEAEIREVIDFLLAKFKAHVMGSMYMNSRGETGVLTCMWE